MDRVFPRLFARGRIRDLEISNRIVKAPTFSSLGARDGSVTDRLLRFYQEASRGGAGLVIVEYVWPDIKARSRGSQIGGADDSFIPGLSALAQVIQDNGAKAVLQIGHPGLLKGSRTPPIQCASRDFPPEYRTFFPPGVVPEELTPAEIRELVAAFGDAASRARKAGFDMVEVHGAHGYLITQFLSPRTNRRTDAYGGSFEKRLRLVTEIITDIREKVGADFPVGIRLNGTEYEPDGIMIEDAVKIAAALEKRGVDAVHISAASRMRGIHLTCPMSIPVGHNVWLAEAVKKAVGIPVIASGSITTPEYAEEILETGKADFIALARPLFADPHWPRKAQEGRTGDIMPCIRCNDGCQERTNSRDKALMCTVNVTLGKEDELPIVPAEPHRKVAVVGGGPAGMEAARVCALRGHEVTLYEKRQLGGALIEASIPDFKADLRRLTAYYIAQLTKLGVKVVVQKASAQTIKDGGFEAVIVATGGLPQKPDIPGSDKPKALGALEALTESARAGNTVHVVGGGVIGVEVGLFLAEQGKKVTFTTRQDELMRDMVSFDRIAYGERLEIQKVTVLTGTRLEAVTEHGSVVVDREGRRREIRADTVVLSTGFLPDTSLRDQLEKETALHVQAVGDCVAPRRIFDAIHEGHLAARRV
ncbi:MAG: FAD-dependent oxidoreductase [Chloroflexota bacterium]